MCDAPFQLLKTGLQQNEYSESTWLVCKNTTRQERHYTRCTQKALGHSLVVLLMPGKNNVTNGLVGLVGLVTWREIEAHCERRDHCE